jgi:hypothetical protein
MQHSTQSASHPHISNTSSYFILVKSSKHLFYINRSPSRQNTPLMVGLYEEPSQNNFNVRVYTYTAASHHKQNESLIKNLFTYSFTKKARSSLYSRIQLFVNKRDWQKSRCVTGKPGVVGPYTAGWEDRVFEVPGQKESPHTIRFSWFSWTFLRSYSKAKPKQNCNKPSPYLYLLAIKIIIIIIIIIMKYYSWFQTFAVLWMLYSFFWVIPRRLNFMCRRFGTLCSIFIGRGNEKNLLVHTTYEDGTECSKTSAHNIQTPGNHPKERIQQCNIS